MKLLEDCPMLGKTDDGAVLASVETLVDDYNIADEMLAMFAETFGASFLGDSKVVDFRNRLDSVRKQLTKSQYSIGFIGPSQSGKSTAVNYVLDAIEKKDQPCKPGDGDNTTSTVCRLLNGDRRVKLIYATLEQYQAKRSQLCEASGFDPASSDQYLLSEVPKRLQDVIQGDAGTLPSGKHILEHDVRLLGDLLQVYAAHGRRLIADNPIELSVPFEERAKYVNYGGNADPANLLLREAHLFHDSEYLSSDLQIFDLPGPGAKSTIDEWTTDQYLNEMDGIMLFVNSIELGEETVERLYAKIRERFKKRTPKRVWVVITRWDSPTEEALEGDGNQSVFSVISKFHRSKGIPGTQIRFVCAPWYKVTDCEAFVRSHFESRLQGYYIPRTLQEFDDLAAGFGALFERGGILSLRELILTHLPRDVRDEISDSAKKELQHLATDMLRRFKNEIRARTASKSQANVATKCRKQMSELVKRMETSLPPFEGAAVNLRNNLWEEFQEICEAPQYLTPSAVPLDFPVHAQHLQQRLLDQLRTIVADLYGAWQKDFDALPDIVVMQGIPDKKGNELILNCGSAWKHLSEEDEELINTNSAQFPTFVSDRLFATHSDRRARLELAEGHAYWGLMKGKISLVAQQVIHATRTALVRRAGEIKSELEQISRAGVTDPSKGRHTAAVVSGVLPISTPDLEKALNRMEELAKCLTSL